MFTNHGLYPQIWKNDYGEVLLSTSRNILTKLQENMTKLEGEIGGETTDLEQLKYVLNVIAEVIAMTQDVELEMMDINERYRTLKRYNIEVPYLRTHCSTLSNTLIHSLTQSVTLYIV